LGYIEIEREREKEGEREGERKHTKGQKSIIRMLFIGIQGLCELRFIAVPLRISQNQS